MSRGGGPRRWRGVGLAAARTWRIAATATTTAGILAPLCTAPLGFYGLIIGPLSARSCARLYGSAAAAQCADERAAAAIAGGAWWTWLAVTAVAGLVVGVVEARRRCECPKSGARVSWEFAVVCRGVRTSALY